MKRKSLSTIFGLLAYLLLCLVPSGQAQTGQPLPYANSPAQLALSWTFNASSLPTGGFTVAGLRYWQITFVPVGTVSGCNVSLDASSGSGFTAGGILSSGTIGSCASASTYTNASATTPSPLGQLTPTITGSGSVIVTLLGYMNNPGAAGSASSTIVSPVDGSGYVEINCKTGCSGSNPNGQATMANSAPVVVSSNQSALPNNVTQVDGIALGAPSAYGTSPGAVNVPGVNASITNTPSVAQSGTWNVGQSGTWTVTATQATGSNLHVVCDSGCSGASSFTDNSAFTVGTTGVGVIAGLYSTSTPAVTAGNAARARIDSNSYLIVDCATGCSSSGGSSIADEGAYTQGTTSFTAIGGLYSTSITNLTTGQVGAFQATADRNLFVNTNKWAGTQLGAPSNYGTSPGAVEVPGVNAFVTNVPAVTVNAGANTIGKVDVLGNAGATVDAAAGATAATNSFLEGLMYNTSPPAPSNGQQEPLQGDSAANLKVNCVVGCSSSGGASLADEGAYTQGTTGFTPIGGYYNTSPTPLTNGQAGAAQMTADRSIYTNINKVGGVAVSLYATLFSAQAATATATSSAVRIPGQNGIGTLWVTGASITGSPSGCQFTLAYQSNTGSPASSTQATITFTPGNSTQGFAVAPTLPSGDQYVSTYSCGTYPTAGTLSVVFDPSTQLPPNQSTNIAQVDGSALGAPSAYGTSPGAVNVPGMNAFVTNTPAVTQSGTWNVRATGNAGGIFDAAQNAAAPANNLNVGGTYNSALPSITSGNSSAFQLDSKGQMLVDLNYVLGAINSKTNGLFVVPGDNTNSITMKAASTQSVAGDTSQVVQINPNQPNLTTPLNVALAANQSVNVAQIGGTAPVIDPCGANAGSQSVINLTAGGQVITGTTSKQTYICALDIVSATAQNIALVEGTGSTCATSTAGMAGGATAATGWNFAANGGLVKGAGSNWVYKTATAADNVCLLLSSTGQTSGEIRYVQQ